jgi:two-component system OmpR family sensor kinase/two-component system sensor histidine kinase BaeS
LAFSVVLLIATAIPILGIYLLDQFGLVHVTYSVDLLSGPDSEGALQRLPEGDLPARTPASEDLRSRILPEDIPVGDGSERPEPLQFDRTKGVEIPLSRGLSAQTVTIDSPLSQFSIDIPAGLAILILLATSLLIGSLLGVWMSRGITRPVTQLNEAAQAIGERDLSYRVPATGSRELVGLANSFNRMAEDLEQAAHIRRNLMADVAHELRTPLTVLEGNLRAMLDGVYDLNEVEIANLYQQTRHLKQLVSDLHELALAESKQLSLNYQTVNLVQLVDETASHFQISAEEKGVRLSAVVDEELYHPSLDDQRTRQVLHNLLSNAIRHTHNGGEVTLSARRLENKLMIAVEDDGEGINPEDLPHIFDRFYRSETTRSRDTGGAGLGLAIVKAIVEAQGGHVEAESGGRDQGSTFTVYFTYPQDGLKSET